MLDRQQRQQTKAVLEDLTSQLEILRETMADVETRIINMTNTLALVSSFPTEIIAAIFKEVGLSDGYSRGDMDMQCRKLPSIVLASHVNRQFRDIAIGTSSLWSSIDLHLSSTMDLYLMDIYLERSKSSLLDIHIVGNIVNFDIVHRVVGRLLPHCGRWRSLSIEADSTVCMHGIIPALQYLCVPKLVSMDISLFKPWDPHLHGVCVSIFSGGALTLRSSKFVNLSLLECRPPLSALDTLDLQVVSPWPMALKYNEFRDILMAAPSLTDLRLSSMVFQLDPEVQLEPVDLPYLQILALSIDAAVYAGRSDLLIDIFKALRIPGLQTFKLYNLYSQHSATVLHYLQAEAHRYPLLHSLALKDVEWSGCLIPDIIHALPNITSLSLIRSAENVVLNLLMDGTTMSPLWSQLKALELAVVDFELLHKFLSSREGRVDSLTLIRCHAVPQDFDEWLKAHVRYVRYIDK